jgi:hypothetical protein
MTAVVSLAYLAGLVWRGFVPRGVGPGTWHMFTGAPYCQLELHERLADGTTRAFDPWRYLPRDQTAMSRGELDLFLLYLARIHHLELDGRVTVRQGARVEVVEVMGTHVVA